MAGLGIQTRGTGIARIQKKGGSIAQRGMGAAFKKGGMAMDKSMAHEGAESMKMEAKETKMEKRGYMENKKGKMVKKADTKLLFIDCSYLRKYCQEYRINIRSLIRNLTKEKVYVETVNKLQTQGTRTVNRHRWSRRES